MEFVAIAQPAKIGYFAQKGGARGKVGASLLVNKVSILLTPVICLILASSRPLLGQKWANSKPFRAKILASVADSIVQYAQFGPKLS